MTLCNSRSRSRRGSLGKSTMYTPLRPCTPADLAAELASPTAEWTRSEGSDGPNSSSAGFRYGPLLLSRGCQVPQLDPLSVRKCLHSRHLLFVGDSFSRYMYLVLATFLVEGLWPSDHELSQGHESPCLESSYLRSSEPAAYQDRWKRYFSGTSTRLRGHELCDCYRKACCHEDELVENRFFKLDKLELSLSFISFGLNDSRWRSHGTVPLGDHHAMRHALRCAPGECGPPSTSSGNGTSRQAAWTWAIEQQELLPYALPALNVTDLLFGSWFHHLPSRNHSGDDSAIHRHELLFARARPFVAELHSAWWRSTTFRQGSKYTMRCTSKKMWSEGRCYEVEDAKADNAAQRLGGLKLMNATALTAQLSQSVRRAYMPDHLHFQCSIYRELLLLLLGAMGCGAAKSPTL